MEPGPPGDLPGFRQCLIALLALVAAEKSFGFGEAVDWFLVRALQGMARPGEVIAEAAGAAYAEGEGVRIVDASGHWVCPGFIDLHVHLREPGGEEHETIETGTASALLASGTSTSNVLPLSISDRMRTS